MRALPAAELARILDGTGDWEYRVKVRRPGEAGWTDLSNVAGGDWVLAISVGNESPDQPVSEFTLRFLMRADGESLSPGDTTSTLNEDAAAAFDPLLYPGTEIRVDAANLADGEARATATWRRWLEGEIEDVAWPTDEVVCTCSSLDGRLFAAQIEEEEVRGAPDPGTPVEDEIQGLATRWMPSPPALYVPVDPNWNVGEYKPRDSVGSQTRLLAQAQGWDLRYRWDEGTGAYRWTLYLPDRDRTTVDLTFETHQVWEIPGLEVRREHVRTAFTGYYVDADGNLQRRTIEDHADAATQAARTAAEAEFGRRHMEIREDATSPIRDAAQMDALLLLAFKDLGDVHTEKRVRIPFFPWMELHDRLAINPDGIRFTSQQEYSITGLSHEVDSEGGASTVLSIRGGSPVGQYFGWLDRVSVPEKDSVPTVDLLELDTSTRRAAEIQITGTLGAGGRGPMGYSYRVTDRTGTVIPFGQSEQLSAGDDPGTAQISVPRHRTFPRMLTVRVDDADGRTTEETVGIGPQLDIFHAIGGGHGRGERESDRTGRPGLPGRRRNATQQLSDDGVDVLVNPLTRRVGTGLAFPGGLGMDTGEEYAGRAGTGLANTGVVQLDVPRLRAAADLPAIDTVGGLLVDTEPLAGKPTVFPVATEDDVAALANGATVEDGSSRARLGLASSTGLVDLDVPRSRSAANLPSISTGAGRLVPTEPVEGGLAYPVDTADDVAALANGATVEDGSSRARTGLAATTGVVALAVPLSHAGANIDAVSTTELGRLDPVVPVVGGTAYPVDTADSVEILTDGTTVKSNAAAGKTADDDLTSIAAAGDLDRVAKRVLTAKRVEDEVGTQTLESTRGARRKSHDGAGVAARGLVEAARDREGQPGLSGARATSQTPVTADGVTELVDPSTGRMSGLAFPGGLSATDGEDYAGRAGSGLSLAGVVQLDVPLVNAAANVPAITTGAGRLDPTEPVEGGVSFPVDTGDAVAALSNGADVEDGSTRARTALELSGTALKDTVTQSDGVEQRAIAKGHQKGSGLLDYDQDNLKGAVTFSPVFNSPPMILLRGGISHNGLISGTQAREVVPENVSASGFNLRAKNVQRGNVAPQNDLFAAGVIDAVGEALAANLDPGGASGGEYTVEYQFDATTGASSTVDVTVAIDTNDGGGWVERETMRHLVGPDSNWSEATVLQFVVSGLGLNDDIRVRIKAQTLSGTASYSVDPLEVRYNTSTDTEEPATESGKYEVSWEAMAVS